MRNLNPLAADLDHILDQTRSLWDELRGQRIFITGGTGFFGCWLLESFLWANNRLSLGSRAVVLTRNPEAFRQKTSHLVDDPAVTLVTGDVRTFDYPSGQFSHVIHAATESKAEPNNEHPLLMLDSIVEGTRRALDFADKSGTGKFLLTSSGAVYGQQPPEMIHIAEDYQGVPDPMDPRSAYGQGKRLAEDLCILYGRQSHIEPKIARCFAFVGPYLPLNGVFAIGNFIRDGLNGGPILVQGDGTPWRSYLYAADLAIWLWTILFQGSPCRPYNVGSEQSISIKETAEMVGRCFTPFMEVKIRQKGDPKAPASRYVPDITRAKAELGLRELITRELACRRTISYLQPAAPARLA
jgi:nucleoside-diphosphate-sugar epimerase